MSGNQGAIYSNSESQSLANEKGKKLGAGQWWYVTLIFGELDYFRIQEKSVKEPLSEDFITTPIFWYFLQRGTTIGVFFCSFLILVRFMVMFSVLAFDPRIVYPSALFSVAAYIFYLSQWIIYRPIYHNGAHTKAVSLVFHMATTTFIMISFIKLVCFQFFYDNAQSVYDAAAFLHPMVASTWKYIYEHTAYGAHFDIVFFLTTLAAIGTIELVYCLRLKELKAMSETPKKYALPK